MPRLTPSRTLIASFDRQPSRASSQGGYDDGLYCLQLAAGSCPSVPPPRSAPISCALSDSSVRTYHQGTHALTHSVAAAHGSAITDLCHSGQGQQVVVTSGQDGLVRLFDLRQPAPAGATPEGLSRAVAEMRLPRKEEALSVSLGYGGTLAAVGGSRGLVHFFDLRSVGGGGGGSGGGSPPSLLGTYQDAHTDEVTGVRFQPAGLSGGTTSLLVTSSEDGLVCTHDTSQPSEELALASVLNVATPPREVGFFGPAYEGLYCLTGSETVQIWHHDSAQRIFDFGDVRERLSQSSGLAVEYLVGCQWDGSDLSLAAGNSEGDAALFKVDAGSMSLTHTLSSGHKGCIRGCILSRDESEKRVLLTGGEDARLCEWNIDGQQPSSRAALQTGSAVSPQQRVAGRGQQPRAGGGPMRHGRKKKTSAPY